jgi:hypothetical protein
MKTTSASSETNPDEFIRRAFTQIAHTDNDLANLETMRARLTIEVRALEKDARNRLFWLNTKQDDGRGHRVIVIRPNAVLSAERIVVVGFCGQKRADLSEALSRQMSDLDTQLVHELSDHPHMLAYSSLQLADGNWHNLVLIAHEDGIPHWRESARHIYSANEFTPRYYSNIRLHNGELPNGLASQKIILSATKYYDFDCTPYWYGSRGYRNSLTA